MGGCRGHSAVGHFSHELRVECLGAAGSPKGQQSFSDFKFPPWQEHKICKIILGGKRTRGWVKGVQMEGAGRLAELQIFIFLLTRLQFHSEHH